MLRTVWGVRSHQVLEPRNGGFALAMSRLVGYLRFYWRSPSCKVPGFHFSASSL
jgi:hypothetical protein